MASDESAGGVVAAFAEEACVVAFDVAAAFDDTPIDAAGAKAEDGCVAEDIRRRPGAASFLLLVVG